MIIITELRGNLSGLKNRTIEELEELTNEVFSSSDLVDNNFLHKIINKIEIIERRLAILINRRGEVLRIRVGNLTEEFFENMAQRRSNQRLSGLRCIYLTFDQDLDTKTDILLKEYRLDLVLHIRLDDLQSIEAKIHYPQVKRGEIVLGSKVEGPFQVKQLNMIDYLTEVQSIEEKLSKEEAIKVQEREEERAILVGLETSNNKSFVQKETLVELRSLVQTAGLKVAGEEIQHREQLDSRYYIGYGKVKELKELKYTLGANVIIFDHELNPAQQRNLEEELEIKVIDRTQVILDIFAQHANTREGKLQIELAQLNYLLPRLTGKGVELSRLAGGIGTRGPGESKLEVDRRRIRKRINNLNKKIDKAQKTRFTQRSRRRLPTVSLVGYTNAGKSTLLNKLTSANVMVKDELFATLDSNTCKLKLPIGREILISDTVGFIRKLPHQLIAAFRATLEEVEESDILLHVVDVSQADYEEKIDAVLEVLSELDVLEKPIVTVLNKIDMIDDREKIKLIKQEIEDSLAISAVKGEGIDKLLERISGLVLDTMVEIELLLPYSDAGSLDLIHQSGKVIEEDYNNKGIFIKARVSQEIADSVDEDYIVSMEPLV
ncbi:GTPase HflX [Selenihalanaerobacter shriftii]|uniref:GTPase HflX n=1 Tax=Selenihalanaerobacter shriftii TaxID=142842 RepID=A0A1T4L4C0_9FIRM|nr:GTPase HflX [Selenihalanaerobacter shriftii]SJZ49559.1 GTP-binding protein HflX [Selenihalanaerobacter shriftii]